MRYVLTAACVIHAVAHLVGFAAPWHLIDSSVLTNRTSILWGRIDLGEAGMRVYGLFWLAVAIGFMVLAGGVSLRSPWWLRASGILIAVSLVFCVLSWPDARAGVLANFVVLGMVLATFRFGGGPMPVRNPTLDALWASAPPLRGEAFDPAAVADLPAPAARYIGHVIAPGTPLASAVRLAMHGEIKLGSWHPFQAEQVIFADGSFVWTATTSMYGLPIRGADQVLGGEGSMRWSVMDLFPVMSGAGPDITRSAIGRAQAELAAWLPPVLLGNGVVASASDPGTFRARVTVSGESSDIELETDSEGRLRTIRMMRWGNPDGGEPGYMEFGVVVDEERRFGGFTIPSRVRAGWFFGTDRFESEGEFFRAVIDHATYQ